MTREGVMKERTLELDLELGEEADVGGLIDHTQRDTEQGVAYGGQQRMDASKSLW